MLKRIPYLQGRNAKRIRQKSIISFLYDSLLKQLAYNLALNIVACFQKEHPKLKDMTAQQESDKVVNYLDVAAKCSGLLIVKILDIQGRIAKTIKEKVEEGVNQLSLNISDLKNGRYVVNIFNNDEFIQAVRVNID